MQPSLASNNLNNCRFQWKNVFLWRGMTPPSVLLRFYSQTNFHFFSCHLPPVHRQACSWRLSLCGRFERTWSGSVLPYQRAPDHGDRDNNHKEDTDDDSLFSDHCGPDHDYDHCASDHGDNKDLKKILTTIPYFITNVPHIVEDSSTSDGHLIIFVATALRVCGTNQGQADCRWVMRAATQFLERLRTLGVKVRRSFNLLQLQHQKWNISGDVQEDCGGNHFNWWKK